MFLLRHPLHQHEPQPIRPGLKKEISLAEATVYGLGIILGAGIYALIGEAAGIAGNSLWLSFIFAAAVASFTALSYCELSSMFPKSAAEYIYVKNAFKSSLLGFLMGWISMFAAMVSVSAVSLGFAGYFVGIFGTPLVLTAIAAIVVLSIVNFLGVKESSRLNLVLTVVAISGLVLIIIMGIPFFGSVDYFAGISPSLGTFDFLNNITIAAALIFFAYIGFEDIANISEETVNAKHAVPKAILLALIVSTVLYVLVAISSISIVPWAQLAESKAPISLVAGTVLGPVGATVFAFIALFATASTVLIILVAVSRMLYGMANDNCLPKLLARVHGKTHTPFVAIALTSSVAILFVFIGDIRQVAFITNFGVFAMFFMVNLSAIVARYTRPDDERIFRVPCNVGKFPIISFLGVVAALFMISRVEFNAILFGSAALVVGIPVYFIFNHGK